MRSRRDFLRLAAAAAGLSLAGTALQACGAGPAAPSSSAVSSPAASDKPAAASTKPAASAAPAASAKPAAGGLALTVDWAPVAVISPLFTADAVNAFSQQGLKATLTNLASSAVVPAMVAKEVDVWMASAGPVLQADLNAQLDLVYLGVTAEGNTASLYVAPSIQSPADLKGKVVATDRPGTPTDYFTRVLLSLVGLKPSDVNMRPLGTSEVTYQALIAGQVQAAAMVVPFNFQAEAQGFHSLKDAFGLPYLTNGPVVRRSRIEELKPALPAFLAGLRQGILAFNDRPDVAKSALTKYTGINDDKVLQKSYDFFKTTVPFNPSLQIKNKDSLQGMLDFLAETMPAAKNAKPEQFIDTRFLPLS